MMKRLLILLIAAAGSTAAWAQDAQVDKVINPPVAPPSIVGTWEVVSINRALNGHGLTPADAKLNAPSRVKFSVISRQEGGTFAGERHMADGTTEPYVGAFQTDGKRFISTSATNSGFGMVDGDVMESCFFNISPEQHGVGCSIYRRAK